MTATDPDRNDPKHEESDKADEILPSDEQSNRRMSKPYSGPDDRRGITARGRQNADDLRMDKEFAEMIVDTVRDGLLVLDLDLRVQAANESFYRMFDVSPGEIEGRLIYELNGGRWDIPELRESLERILPENKVFNDVEVEQDFDETGPRVMVLNARQLDDHEMILLAIDDVTERRSSERRLLESEDRYRFFVENAQEYAIFHLDPEGHIMSWNRGAQRVFGYAEDEVVGRPVAVIFTDSDRAAGEPQRERKTAAAQGRTADDRWHVRKDGSRFWASGAIEALRQGNVAGGEIRGFTKILRDNTERKQTEEALRSLNEELEQRVRERTAEVRRLASTLTMAEQQERRRVSQVLHDDLQQILYGIQMKWASIRSELEVGERMDLQQSIEDVGAWLDAAIRTTRRLTADLSPPVLKNEGLTEAFDWLRNQMLEMHGLHVDVSADQAFSVPNEDVRVLIFQIVRELLFNVVKHAETDRAVVEIKSVDGHLMIRVSDEGCGFDLAKAARRSEPLGGFGLFSVRDRLSLLRGRLDIVSAPGAGTSVTFVMPLDPDSSATLPE